MNQTSIDTKLLSEIEIQASDMAKDVGKFLIEAQKNIGKVEYKGVGKSNPVTEADRAAESQICSAIKKYFPAHSILGEEGSAIINHRSPFLWVIDPLDGTSNFVKQSLEFAVSIGILHNGVPVASAIFLPPKPKQTAKTYHAKIGGGSFIGETQIFTKSRSKSDELIRINLPSHYKKSCQLSKKLRGMDKEICEIGSIAYSMALTAEGTYDCSMFTSPRSWDVAAGILLVKEAGGCVFQMDRQGWKEFEAFQILSPKPHRLAEWHFPILSGSKRMAPLVASELALKKPIAHRLMSFAKKFF